MQSAVHPYLEGNCAIFELSPASRAHSKYEVERLAMFRVLEEAAHSRGFDSLHGGPLMSY